MNYNLPPQNLGNLIDVEKRVEFVRACGITEKPKILDSDDIPETSTPCSFIQLYENLPEESNKSKNSKKEPKIEDSDDDVMVLDEIEIKREPGTQKVDIRDVNGYLKAAKDGNLEELRRFLKKKIPIDVTDFYGWTATMCAAGDGNFEICKYLLENGADPGVRDKNGMGILQIAQKNRKETFVRLLMDYFCNGSAPSTSAEPEKLTYCELCDTFVDEKKINDHISSITHQLNDKSKPGVAPQSGIHLGPSNIGYRLMCASGWTEQQGLGRNSDGHRFPIKTILKRNRTGLGMESLPKKVTHFGPLDRNSVRNEKSKKQPVTKKDLERKKRKEDRITKKYRADFGDNDSVYEYFNAEK